MAKTKAKKKGMSDKVRTKKGSEAQRVNPFEVKFNRSKHHVLGKKITKDDRGRPGQSRAKSIKKRKETLLLEYKTRGKSNKFIDRRFGENDPEMPLEEKMLQRYALERQKTHSKGDLFSLNEEEEQLTHYGQSLSEIEKFDNPIDSDEDDETTGKISASMVGEQHFGGGFLTLKKSSDQQDGRQMSWKERMEELITKSKREKYDRQNERELSIQMTEKLDEEWKTLRLAIKSGKAPDIPEPAKKEGSKADDFDQIVRELKFEARGAATDRLKSDVELAQEEKERLDKMETARLRRMQGLTEEPEPTQSTYKSADDLDDGFSLDSKKSKQVRFEAAFQDGKLAGASSEEEEEEVGGGEGDGSGQEEEGETEGREEDEDEDGSGSEEEGSSVDGMQAASDLESSEEEEEEEEEDEKHKPKKAALKPIIKIIPTKGKSGEEIKEELKKRKETMENARKEIPFTFEAPADYESLLRLFEGRSEEEQLVVVDRLRKCHHPSLAEGNKDKLMVIFDLLVRYYGDLAMQEVPQLSLANRLVRHLYELAQQNPAKAGHVLTRIVNEAQGQLSAMAANRRGRGVVPGLDTLLQLKLISVLFPTSDLRHPVVTPAMVYMGALLTQCSYTTRWHVAVGLFICNLFLEYVSFAKRLVPEALNFLQGVLFLASPTTEDKIQPVIPPFKPVGKNTNILVLEKTAKCAPKPLSLKKLFSDERDNYCDTEEFRVSVVSQTLKLLLSYTGLYRDLSAPGALLSPVRHWLDQLPASKYPASVQESHGELVAATQAMRSTPLTYLARQKQRLQPLKMLDPKIEEDFEVGKRREGTKESQDKQRLTHKYKREMKGAVREVRKDSQFLARIKLNEQLGRDAERKRKVKELYQQLASQEGDYQALKRAKEKL